MGSRTRGSCFERAILVGGPLDGQMIEVHYKTSSRVVRVGVVFHCYRIVGTVAKPERNAEGVKIMRHHSSATDRAVRRLSK